MTVDEAREYAEHRIRQAGEAQSIGWDLIAEGWYGDDELTYEEIDQVYRAIFAAHIDISWPEG